LSSFVFLPERAQVFVIKRAAGNFRQSVFAQFDAPSACWIVSLFVINLFDRRAPSAKVLDQQQIKIEFVALRVNNPLLVGRNVIP
jgi:hypothetical protein